MGDIPLPKKRNLVTDKHQRRLFLSSSYFLLLQALLLGFLDTNIKCEREKKISLIKIKI